MKTKVRFLNSLVILVFVLGNSAAQTQSSQAAQAAISPAAPLASITLTPSADAYIDSANPANNYGGNVDLNVGALSSSLVYRTLSWFDLSPLRGAVIQSASLELFHITGSSYPANVSVSLYRNNSSWSEMGVKWMNQPGAVSINKINPVGIANGYYNWDVTSLVQDWVNGVYPNYGIMLRASPETTAGWRGFNSREAGANPPHLLVTFTTGASSGDAQSSGLSRLKTNSSIPMRFRFRNGIPAYIHARVSTGGTTGDALSQARAYLNAYKDLYRLTDAASQFKVVRRTTEADQSHLYLQQVYAGIPVFGAELGIHLSGSFFDSSNGAYLPDLKLQTEPALAAAEAETLALAEVNKEFPGAAVETAGMTGLVIFDRSLWANVTTYARLAWQVNLRGAQTRAYFIDAQNGAILGRLNQEPAALDMEIFTGNNDWSGWPCWNFPDDPSTLWFTEDGPQVPAGAINADGRAADTTTRDLYAFWRDTFSRRSYDNDDSQIEVVANVNHVAQLGSANSVWRSCDLMELSQGWAQVDVMGHEFTHGVVGDEYNPVYEDESGAVNESLSDTFGEFFEYWVSGAADWQVGESIAGRANPLRSMSDPSAPPFGDPDRLSLYVVTNNDNGGVHTNSGISNKAAWLISNNLVVTFNDIQVAGLPIEESQRIYYRALTHYLAGNAGYASLREALIESAEDIFGAVSPQVCTVRNAFAAVEVGDPDADCDGVESNLDPDDDSDGVDNITDNCPSIANPGQSDLDHDGFGDACDADTDGDWILDTNDNCDFAANPSQLDSDHNGIGDACDDPDQDSIPNRNSDDSLWDNCPTVSNPDQNDYDLDGLGDACDPDADNDGILDDGDNSGTRGDNYCTAGDTTLCDDNAPFSTNSSQADSDRDGVGDVVDNCSGTANPYGGGIYPPVQADTDGDGIGDACDADVDNDGISNQDDNCVYAPNPDQIDLNRNGVGLRCDLDEAFLLSSDAQMADLFFQFNEMKAIVLPIFPCWGGGCPDENSLFPEGQRAVVSLNIPAGFGVRISDENGAMVKRAPRGSTNMLVSFEVNPAYRALPPYSTGFAPATVSADSPAKQPLYFLEIWPTSSTQLGQTFSVKFNLSSFALKTTIYLPFVIR